jgi:hypothetical protein
LNLPESTMALKIEAPMLPLAWFDCQSYVMREKEGIFSGQLTPTTITFLIVSAIFAIEEFGFFFEYTRGSIYL